MLVIDAPSDGVFDGLMIDGGSKGHLRTLTLQVWSPEAFSKMMGG